MAMIQILSAVLLYQIVISPAAGLRLDFCADKSAIFYADPEDCSSFYKCFKQMSFHFNCPTGLVYNERFTVCDWPWNVFCDQRSTPSQKSTTVNPDPDSSTLTSSQAFPSTLLPDNSVGGNSTQNPNPPFYSFCQTKSNNLYPDPENCNSFYQCSNSVSHHFTCQQDLVFNPEQLYCDWTWNVKCSVQIDNPDRSTNVGSTFVGTETADTNKADKCGKVVCYFPNWAIYRRGVGARFGPENINPNLCTHVIYAFATLLGNRLVASEAADEDTGSDIGNFARATNLKMQNPKLKVLLAVGGWNMGSSSFANMADSEMSRAEFITTTIQFLRQRNFDGLSVDWNGPGEGRGVYKEDYTKLCEELRTAFDNEETGEKRLLLTGAVSGVKNVIDTAYDVPRLAAALHFINVMAYDLHGIWEGKTGHGSPLKPDQSEGPEEVSHNVEGVANYWASLGAPKNKLVIGVPLYARTFTLSSTFNKEVGAPITGPGLPGRYTAESGYLSYYEICSMLTSSTKYFIEDQRVPYLVYQNQWAGYEDTASLKEKVQFIKVNGFAGIMVWDISQDDFSGRFCGAGSFPLMNAILSQCV